jgi:putative ABC transport system substrate-binding protein
MRGEAIMKTWYSSRALRIGLGIIVLVVVIGCPLTAPAQQAAKPPRIGIIFYGSAQSPALLHVLLDGLRDIGLVGGRTAAFEIRYAEGRIDRFPALTREVVSLGVDLLITTSTPGALAAKQATSTIPTVVVLVSDPVGSGIAASLARPGGNITGLSMLAPELSAKRLDLLKQAVPRASRVAVLWNVANDGMRLRFRETETAAPILGVTVESVGVRTPEDFEDAFGRMSKRLPDALLVLADTVTMGHLARTVQFAEAHRLPAIYEAKEFVEAGGLMSYGIDFADQYRRAAPLVNKILKGAKPGELPIEQPRKFELVINLKAARALGLTIPPSVLVRADRLIE